jgi:hypothetical protein
LPRLSVAPSLLEIEMTFGNGVQNLNPAERSYLVEDYSKFPTPALKKIQRTACRPTESFIVIFHAKCGLTGWRYHQFPPTQVRTEG